MVDQPHARRPSRRLLLALLGVLAVMPLPARGSAATPAAPGTQPANLILITLDTTRRDHLSCYGYAKQTTPNLDRVAGEGVLFEDAETSIPVTLPSHATMMTGLYPFQNGVRHNGCFVLADSFTTLAEMLKRKGYDTGAVVGAFPVDHRFGLAQGFDDYDDQFPAANNPGGEEAAERNAGEVTRRAVSWIGRHSKKPFFLWAHYYDAHVPYAPPEPYATRFKDTPYDGEIAYVDASVGKLLEALKAKGVDGRTILIIAGDHGESLGEHGEDTHSMFIYGATQNVPLILRLPDSGAWSGTTWHHRRVAGPVSLIDIFPTAWGALGMAESEMPRVAGRSLLPLVAGTGPAHEWLYHETLVPAMDYGMSDLRGLQLGTWMYIRAPRPELYDLAKDPRELTNLAAREKDRTAAMETQLTEILRAEKSAAAPVAMDKETLEKLRSLGYLQGGPAPGATQAAGKRADPKDEIGVVTATSRAQGLAEANRMPEAMAMLDSLLEKHPDTRMALLLRGRYLRQTGRAADGVKDFKRVIAGCQGCPDEVRLHMDLASSYLLAGQTDDALKEAQAMQQLYPKEPGLNLLLGQILERKQDAAGAHQAYAREAELQPGDTQPYLRMGMLDLSQNKQADAEKDYRKALSLDAKNVEALIFLSKILSDTGRQDEAEKAVDRAVAADPASPLAQYSKAWMLRKNGKKEEAVAHFQAAIKAQPGNGALYTDLGSLYDELGRHDEARDCYQKAVSTGNAPAGAYANLGLGEARAGRLESAIQLWQQALQRNPQPQRAAEIRANIERAQQQLSGRGGAGGSGAGGGGN